MRAALAYGPKRVNAALNDMGTKARLMGQILTGFTLLA
jgi:hypothetical protein